MSSYSGNYYDSPQGSYQYEDDGYSDEPYYEDDSPPTRVVENFKGANGFVIDGGDFSTVGGNVYHGTDAATMQQPRPRPPPVSSRTSYFENTSNFTIRDGKFMSVGGDVYGTPTPPSSHGMPQRMAVPNRPNDYNRPYI